MKERQEIRSRDGFEDPASQRAATFNLAGVTVFIVILNIIIRDPFQGPRQFGDESNGPDSRHTNDLTMIKRHDAFPETGVAE